MADFILSLDQGTTSSRALVVNKQGEIKSVSQQEFKQIYPQSGWVEHDAKEIWKTQLECAQEAIKQIGGASKIAALGITNQRETTVVWNRNTGEPVYNAIVWQDRRTAGYCDELKARDLESSIKEKTGLVIDAYFSATKLKWILDNVDGARDLAQKGELAFGTIDSWLAWNLTKGQLHCTDVSNASRTMLFNINTMTWDEELLELFNIPASILPEVKSNSELMGKTSCFEQDIPIAGMAGDQQSALFGQMCTEKGMLKNTYGTGCFLMMNTGNTPTPSKNKLLSTVAWKLGVEVTYALEGSIFMGGATIQWLRDELQIIKESPEVEELANKVDDNGGVYLVPAFAGLGAPHWDQYARGTLLGMSRGSNKSHVARAALESIAYQTKDVVTAMEADANIKLNQLRVDGGASVNNTLMQFQSDILNSSVVRPKTLETTAMGAAYFAGLAVGFWENVDEIKKQWREDKQFSSKMDETSRLKLLKTWDKALNCAKGWAKED